MAIIRADVYSKSLDKNVLFNVFLPIEEKWHEACRPQNFPTLYLLHGHSDNQNTWLERTAVSLYAAQKGVAVVMPAGDNSFYVNNEEAERNYSTFIGEELVQMTRDMLPLSPKREDTFIAGLSMGGYGAVHNGLKYHETFSAIGAFSSAFFSDSLSAQNLQSDDQAPLGRKRGYFEGIFGNLDKLKDSDKDEKALLLKLQKEEKSIPKLWITCGTEDFLLTENRSFYDFLKAHHIPATYTEEAGGHQWPYWDRAVKAFLDWL